VPRAGFELVIKPFLPTFRERHPRIELDLSFEDRRVDIVREGFDAGIRLREFVERDMVSLRLTGPLQFIVVGAGSYLKNHGTPERPEDLLRHECLTFHSETRGSLYAWELERGRRNWRLPVHGSVVTNNRHLCIELALQGLGLAYAFEPLAREHLRSRRLIHVLKPYAAAVPGFYLYYPSRAQRSAALGLAVDAVRDFAAKESSSASSAKEKHSD
jgi:DNA-binding transcriptional LysR family regulator